MAQLVEALLVFLLMLFTPILIVTLFEHLQTRKANRRLSRQALADSRH
ncbi:MULTISPECIES: hypothetical protein [unclassified Vibrio]|nr:MULTISPECIES: hypothetical protein [unclassified Vibrio]